MKMFFVFVLLFLVFNLYPEGQIENTKNFKMLYTERIGNNITIYVIICIKTNDLFLIVRFHPNVYAGGISIIKLDDKYKNFLEVK